MADVEVEPSPPGTLTAGTAQSQGATLSAQLSSSSTNNGRNFFPRALRNSPGLRPTDDGNGIQGVRMEVFSLRLPTPGTTMTRRIPELDTLLFRVGNPGRYQFLAFLTLSLTCLVIAPNNLAILFWGEEPTEYRCTDDTPAVENLLRWDNGTMTASYEEYLRWSVEDGRWNSSDVRQCTVEMRVPEAGYSERYYCRNWTFPGEEDATLVTDFHLVCRDRWRVNLATTIYFLGLLVGALLFGFLADHYGRRVVILISGSAAVIFGVGTSFSRNYAAFIVLRFLLGILLQGMQIAFILTVEWLPVVKRSFFGTLSQLIWSVGVMFLAFLGYLFPNWNDLQLAMSLVGLLLVMTYFFLVEESIRWLLVKNRTEEASDSLVKILRFNRIATDMTWEMEHELLSVGTFFKEKRDKRTFYTIVDCFRTPRLRRVSLCMMYIWFSCAIGYYGLFLSIDRLVPNLALNVFINGALELIPCLISIFVVPRYGRKQPMIVFNFLGGFACILSCLVRGNTRPSAMGRTALTLIGRLSLTGSACSFFIWAAELYPTVMRGNGIGVCMFALRLGGVLAPQLLALGPYTFREFPVTVLGIIALGGVVAAYPLPETINVNLPDTLPEAENFGCKEAELRKSRDGLSLSSLTSVRMSHLSSQ